MIYEKVVTTDLIDGNPKGTQHVSVSNKISDLLIDVFK